MFAPRRTPPCFVASVAALNGRMNEIGPDATPDVDRTELPAARRRENENPVPPPVLCTSAIDLIASNTPSIVSGTGITKHALYWFEPPGRPALTRHGVFGRNSSRTIRPKNASATRDLISGTSASAIASAMRPNI